ISFDVYKNIKDNQYYLTLHILYSLPAEDNSYDIIYRNTQVLAYFKLEEEDVNKNDKEEPVSLYGYTYKFESASILYGEN
ncbi:MAG: hypothetical protein LBH40_01710, partial [Alphaproteobacteria bacterium]|nr:hypothetical protein [Alphaproteobacteria bacterium]